MKRTMVMIVLVVLVAATLLLWTTQSGFGGTFRDWGMIAVAFTVLGFAAFIGIRRLKSHSRSEPADDELSRNLMRRASSLSYYISIYLWLALSFASDHLDLATSTIIGTGILGMAVILFICWLYFRIWGIRHE